MRQNLPFKNYLGRCRYLQIVGLTFHQWNRSSLQSAGDFSELPVTASVAAVSVGLLDGGAVLDLCYEEDFKATVDMNVVMTDKREFVEVQGTGEDAPFSQSELTRLLKLAQKGIAELIAIQNKALQL